MRLGITVGDPAGIGPEVVSLALAAAPVDAELRVYGDVAAVERAGGLPAGTDTVPLASAEVQPGKPCAESVALRVAG